MSQRSIVKPSSIAYQLAEDAALEELQSEKGNDSLKQIWLKLATQLEVENIPKHQISTIGKKIIIEKKKEQLKKLNISQQRIDEVTISGWWREVMSDEGYTDSKFDSSGATEPSPENSSLNSNNPDMVDLLYDIKEVCSIAITKAKEYQNFEEIFGQKETREYYKQLRTIIKNCKYAFDGKTKVPENTEHLLLQCIAVSSGSIAEGGVMFMKARTTLLEEQRDELLTTKQLSKFQNGDKISTLPLLKPTSRDPAVFLDYLGIPCPKCGFFSVRKKTDSSSSECYDCNNTFTHKTVAKCRYCQIPLYKENLLHIVNTGKCENCNTENILPDELIEYAKS